MTTENTPKRVKWQTLLSYTDEALREIAIAAENCAKCDIAYKWFMDNYPNIFRPADEPIGRIPFSLMTEHVEELKTREGRDIYPCDNANTADLWDNRPMSPWNMPFSIRYEIAEGHVVEFKANGDVTTMEALPEEILRQIAGKDMREPIVVMYDGTAHVVVTLLEIDMFLHNPEVTHVPENLELDHLEFVSLEHIDITK